MKILKAALALVLLSFPQFSHALEPSENVENALPALHALANRWSWQIHTHGTPSHHGFGIGLETPGFWGWLAFQLTYAFDSADDALDQTHTWGTLSPAVKLHLTQATNPPILPYAMFGWDVFYPTEPRKDTGGSRTGIEFIYGAEMRFINRVWNDLSRDHAVFMEVGWADSTFRSEPSPGGVRLHNGTLVRLGFRQFF